MAQIGIQDQDTIRCYGRLLGGAQRYRQATTRHSGSVDVLIVWAGAGVANKKSMLSVW